MQIITNPYKLQAQCLAWRQAGETISLVPTMGYYHKGHESLMQKARETKGKLVVSLFLNPTQFSATEDLSTYPKDLEKDTALAEQCGVDVLFCPQPDDMYAKNHVNGTVSGSVTWVEVDFLTKKLCGKSRPEHFKGVTTVVSKLFMLVQPHKAFFGEKDWQQLAVLRQMAKDLFMPIELVGCPLIREADGLALSSRNVYLTAEERAQAPYIQKGLLLAKELVVSGEKNKQIVQDKVQAFWKEHLTLARIDYFSFVDPASLEDMDYFDSAVLVAGAFFFGKARLIDNMLVQIA